MDLLLEFVVVGEVQVNFLEGEVDEHTSDLGGEAGVALHLSEDLGDLEVELVSGGDILPVVVLVVELLELLEAELILGLFVLDLSELLELVMADLELSLSVESVVQELDGVLGLVGGLEANKGVGLLGGLNGEHLDGLDFTVFLEDLLEVLVVELGVKVLDVEVASLLGVLVLDGLTDELGLSLGSSQGGLDVKEFTVTHVSTVEGIDGFESFLGSVLVVVLVLRHVADKGESLLDLDSAFLVLAVHLDEGSNVTEGSEKGLELLIREGLG